MESMIDRISSPESYLTRAGKSSALRIRCRVGGCKPMRRTAIGVLAIYVIWLHMRIVYLFYTKHMLQY
jgi:hypothetical protein